MGEFDKEFKKLFNQKLDNDKDYQKHFESLVNEQVNKLIEQRRKTMQGFFVSPQEQRMIVEQLVEKEFEKFKEENSSLEAIFIAKKHLQQIKEDKNQKLDTEDVFASAEFEKKVKNQQENAIKEAKEHYSIKEKKFDDFNQKLNNSIKKHNPKYYEQRINNKDDFICVYPGEPKKVSSALELSGKPDDAFKQALKLVVERGQASISMLQRYFCIGFSRAARLIDEMEARGFISQADGCTPRKVLIDIEGFKNEFGDV